MSNYYKSLYDDAIAAINSAKLKARQQLEGQSAGLLREGKADIALKRDKFGDIVGQALENKMRGKFGQQLQSRLAGLESNYMNTLAGLKQKKDEMRIQEKIASDQARANLMGNIFGGLGSLASLVFPPAGIAGDAIGNMIGQTISSGAPPPNVNLPEFST